MPHSQLHKVFALPTNSIGTWRATIAKAIPSAVFWAYATAALVHFVAVGTQYFPLETIAGRVFLKDPKSASVYNYVVTHTSGDDALADVSCGGGINFAARRRGPLFMTGFGMIAPGEEYLLLDARRIVTERPRLVIGNTDDRLGTRYGGGTTNGCTFPHLVWRSGRITGDPARVLPIVSSVKQHYTPVFRAGNIQVLERDDLPGVTRVSQ